MYWIYWFLLIRVCLRLYVNHCVSVSVAATHFQILAPAGRSCIRGCSGPFTTAPRLQMRAIPNTTTVALVLIKFKVFCLSIHASSYPMQWATGCTCIYISISTILKRLPHEISCNSRLIPSVTWSIDLTTCDINGPSAKNWMFELEMPSTNCPPKAEPAHLPLFRN